MHYEWDERKRIANFEKHGLDLAEAWKVFEASTKVTLPAPLVETGEVRWMDVAEVGGVALVLVYTMRGDSIRGRKTIVRSSESLVRSNGLQNSKSPKLNSRL